MSEVQLELPLLPGVRSGKHIQWFQMLPGGLAGSTKVELLSRLDRERWLEVVYSENGMVLMVLELDRKPLLQVP